MARSLGWLIAVGAGLASCKAPGPPEAAGSRPPVLVDLTHPLHDGMAYWPGGVPFKKTRLADYDQGYRAHRYEMGENTGTHVDAPCHFIPNQRCLDGIHLGELYVPAVVIDVSAQVKEDVDYQVSEGDLDAFEVAHGPIPRGALVLVRTGWGARFQDPLAYVNQDDEGVMHFPGVGPDAARKLLAREVVGVGIDTLSIDHGASVDFAAHRILLTAGKYQLENLANLDRLPARGATVLVGVLPVVGGTQAQARVIAFVSGPA